MRTAEAGNLWGMPPEAGYTQADIPATGQQKLSVSLHQARRPKTAFLLSGEDFRLSLENFLGPTFGIMAGRS